MANVTQITCPHVEHIAHGGHIIPLTPDSKTVLILCATCSAVVFKHFAEAWVNQALGGMLQEVHRAKL